MLEKGLQEHFVDNKGMRMMTLTLAPAGYSEIEHAQIFQQSFKNFVKYLRRSSSLSETQKQFKYVRCIELHQGSRRPGHHHAAIGYVHYHIIIDRFLPVEILQKILNAAVLAAGYQTDKTKFCNVNIILVPNIKTATRYVIKYITKAVSDFGNLLCKWSKSKGTPIFTKDKREGIYILVRNSEAKAFLSLYLYTISHESPKKIGVSLARSSIEIEDSYTLQDEYRFITLAQSEIQSATCQEHIRKIFSSNSIL